MKKIMSLTLVLIMVFGVVSFAGAADEELELNVVIPKGTPALSMVKMINDSSEMKDNVKLNYQTIGAVDKLSSMLITEEADIAIVPTNLAANIYNKEIPYKLAGSSVWGVLYLVSNQDISSFADLKGKEINMFGRNLTPDATLKYVLTKNGIDPDNDLDINYYSGGSELVTNFLSKQVDTALIPQPLLTKALMKRKDAKVVIDIQKEWTNVTGLASYPQASLIVNDKLIENHPEVVELFLDKYEKATGWINQNPKKAGEYYENLGIGLNAKIIEKAIDKSNIEFIRSGEAKQSLKAYLGVLYDFNPKLLGGKVPDEDFYYQR